MPGLFGCEIDQATNCGRIHQMGRALQRAGGGSGGEMFATGHSAISDSKIFHTPSQRRSSNGCGCNECGSCLYASGF